VLFDIASLVVPVLSPLPFPFPVSLRAEVSKPLVVADAEVVLVPGPGLPAASNFLLLRQKKVTKEKATRSLGPYASLQATCAARLRRRSAELATLHFAQTTAARPSASVCAARPSQDGEVRMRDQYQQGHAMACPCFFRCSGLLPSAVGVPPPPPSVCAEERRARRIRAKTCWRRRRVVFAPGGTEHRRLPVAKRRVGDSRVAFSLLTFSWRSKRK
jgi:hypothetical protein